MIKNLNDILKPKSIKDFINKYYYIKSSVNIKPPFIIKVIDFNTKGMITCKVIYNNFGIVGPIIYTYAAGEVFYLSKEDFIDFEFKLLDDFIINNIENEILKLNKFKNFLENLLNE